MTFQELKALAFGRITVEELSQGLVQKLGDVSIAEATKLVEAAKTSLTEAMEQGDQALSARIKLIEDSIASGDLHTALEEIKGRLTTLEAKDKALQGEVDAVEADLAGHKEAYNAKVQALEAKDQTLTQEIEKLKSTVSGKNNDTQVFADMEAFKAYDTEQKEAGTLKKGDMAYVVSVKRSYIYNPGSVVMTIEDPTPPEGWIFFDQITSDLDLSEYAKKTEVEAVRGEFAAADAQTLNSAKAYTDEKIGEVNTAAGELSAKVTALEGKVDVAKVSEAINAAVNPVSQKANANEAAITILNGNAETEGSVDYKIKQAKDAIDQAAATLAGRVGTLEGDVTKAKADILDHAGKIAALEASRFVLTRKQELIDTVPDQTEYTLTSENVPENAIVDVFVNSVRLVEGEDKDYTLVGKVLTLKKARAAGGVIQVLFTFTTNAPTV